MNTQRIDRVRANLQARDLDQLLIVDPLSIWWLTGYYTEPYERLLALHLPHRLAFRYGRPDPHALGGHRPHAPAGRR